MQQAASAEDYKSAVTERDALNMLKLQQRRVELELDKENRIIRYEIGAMHVQTRCTIRWRLAIPALIVSASAAAAMRSSCCIDMPFSTAGLCLYIHTGHPVRWTRLSVDWQDAATSEPKTHAPAGMVIRHRRYSYRGVILGHDDHCTAPEAWIQVGGQWPWSQLNFLACRTLIMMLYKPVYDFAGGKP
jgi:Hemimethylated DNA-binding protein YccV like